MDLKKRKDEKKQKTELELYVEGDQYPAYNVSKMTKWRPEKMIGEVKEDEEDRGVGRRVLLINVKKVEKWRTDSEKTFRMKHHI